MKFTYKDLHEHKTIRKPHYKALYERQLNTNKSLLLVIGIILALAFCLALGCHLYSQRLQAEIGALQSQYDKSLEVLVDYADQSDYLAQEVASCSAKLKLQKLSPKARTHMKQQPIVAEKIKQTFGEDWVEATELLSRESSLNPQAINPSSKACGLGQALPCSKMSCSLDDVDCQLNWVKNYILGRYGSVTKALAFHDSRNWY